LHTLVQRICFKRNLEIRKTESKEKPYSYVRHLYRSRTHERKKDGSNTHKWAPNIFTPHLATGNHQQVLPMNNNLCKKSPTEQSPPIKHILDTNCTKWALTKRRKNLCEIHLPSDKSCCKKFTYPKVPITRVET
jgi:hypothetical protein